MKYTEYEKAAKRHRETCGILLGLHKDGFLGDNPLRPDQKTKILQNIYYLSGYIIECIFSYKFFDLIKYNKNYSVKNLKEGDLTYSKVFANHRMEKIIEYIGEKGGAKVNAIPIIGRKEIKDIHRKMFHEWKTEVRYTVNSLTFHLTFENVKAFYDLSDNIYKQTKNL